MQAYTMINVYTFTYNFVHTLLHLLLQEPPYNGQLGANVKCPLFGRVRCAKVLYYFAYYDAECVSLHCETLRVFSKQKLIIPGLIFTFSRVVICFRSKKSNF